MPAKVVGEAGHGRVQNPAAEAHKLRSLIKLSIRWAGFGGINGTRRVEQDRALNQELGLTLPIFSVIAQEQSVDGVRYLVRPVRPFFDKDVDVGLLVKPIVVRLPSI